MTPEEEKRCEVVLSAAFQGMHHCPTIKKTSYYWSVNAYGGLSTHDFDMLTVLVFAAHDQGVRVEVSHSGPRLVKLLLHPRRHRKGNIASRHPTLEEKVKEWRDRGHTTVELPDADPEDRKVQKSQPGLEQPGAPVLDNAGKDEGPREEVLPNQAVPYIQITEECFVTDKEKDGHPQT